MSTKLGFFILVDAGDNDVHKIREELLQIDEVVLVHCLIGPDDLICYGEADSLAALKEIVTFKLAHLIEDKFNPISHTQTSLSLEYFGEQLTAEKHGHPTNTAAWILADINISGAINISERLLSKHPEIKSAHALLGSHDTLFYVEAEDLDRLMEVIDDGVRILRGIGNEGKSVKALSRTDTRLVLMK
ncbi:Lrp/AsnC ligand binding domain-containing protein [Zooshikella sp. RANM57]|uniref:Lrp/AsnC ligand binding domain-containing protein n=1 Tax=Zooshikella sp. RANM57 TaxID=3425863 RepID=UPI003D6EAA48